MTRLTDGPGLHSGDSLPDLADGFRLAQWDVDPRTNRVFRDGERISVEPKVMQVLLLLARFAGEPVTRDRIMESVWSDVVVTDDTLTRCVSEARKIFDAPGADRTTRNRPGDARRNSIIETIPRVGYRLTAQVDRLPRRSSQTPDLLEVAVSEPKSPLSSGPTPPPRKTWIMVATISIVLVTAFIVRWNTPEPAAVSQTPVTARPVTSFAGRETMAAWSPVDDRIAYVQIPDTGSVSILGTIRPGDVQPFHVFEGPVGSILSPTWAPDGSEIWFVDRSTDACQIMSVPSLGGPASEEMDCHGRFVAIDLSPDGRWIAMDGQSTVSDPVRIRLVQVETGEILEIGNNNPLTHDYSPSFSEDGGLVQFTRSLGEGQSDQFEFDTTSHEIRRLSREERNIAGFDWAGSSHVSVVSTGMTGNFGLNMLDHETGRFTPLGIAGYRPSVDRAGTRIVYETMQIDTDLMVFRGDEQSNACPSTRYDRYPVLAPDGRSVVFVSDRQGPTALYRCNLENGHLEAIQTPEYGTLITPAIGPDGRVVLTALDAGEMNLYVIDQPDAEPRRLTKDGSNDMYPVWSGEWIWFTSDRGSDMNIWRMPPGGTRVEQVTSGGALMGRLSPDDAYLYFLKPGKAGLWRLAQAPAETGSADGAFPTSVEAAELVDADIDMSDIFNWRPYGKGVLIAETRPDRKTVLEFVDPETRNRTLLRTLPSGVLSFGMTTTDDLSLIIVTVLDRVDSDLMVIPLPHGGRS